jgi:hypothetical protein
MRYLLLAFAFSACATAPPVLPRPGASRLQVDPTLSRLERFEAYDQLKFSPTVIQRTVVRSGRHGTSVRTYRDRTALAQGGEAFSLGQYLPTLQAEGIATDVEDPTPHMAKAALVGTLWGTAGLIAGSVVLIRGLDEDGGPQSEDKLMNTLLLSTSLYVGGYIVGMIHGLVVSKPAREAMERAISQRAGWARTFNRGVAKKFQIQDGPSLIPAANPPPPALQAAPAGRHK